MVGCSRSGGGGAVVARQRGGGAEGDQHVGPSWGCAGVRTEEEEK